MTMPAAWVEAWRCRPSSFWAMSKARATTGSLSPAACRRRSAPIGRRAGSAECDRVERVLRHELAELVDLAVRHLQHPPDIAQHAARLQRAEGDDLRHAFAAVAFLHITDDFVATILAEVDIEVGHRHPLGIEEAFEQQPETDGIEIGDGEGVGDERAGARAAPRPDRNALRLRPLDEVGNDKEIAG